MALNCSVFPPDYFEFETSLYYNGIIMNAGVPAALSEVTYGPST